MTSQRRLIYDTVRKSMTHPTADEIYEKVRKRLPRISLATVYRNLEVLSEQGLIRKLELGASQKRFDRTIDDHYHIRCGICGKIDDLPASPAEGIEQKFEPMSGYLITGHTLEFSGICPECRKNQ